METRSDPNAPQTFDARTCPILALLDAVGSKWSSGLLGILAGGPKRFGALRRDMAGISRKMLTQTLRGLERDGLVRRSVFATTPPQVEYSLTALGKELAELLEPVARWAGSHIAEIEIAREAFDARQTSLTAVP